MKQKALNLALFQIGWFACVLSAAWEAQLLGLAYVIAWLGVRLLRSEEWYGELLTIFIAAATGFVFDSVLTAAGVMSFPGNAWHSALAPLWMIALWMNLAGTLNGVLRWLSGRYALSAILGALGGPLAYYAGASLGAVELGEPLSRSLLLISLEWTAAMPLLIVLSDWFRMKTIERNQRLNREVAISEERR